jgi:hypothetical protein
MGYALCWAAVKGGPAEMVHSILGICPTGQRERIHDSDIVGAQLPSGWYMVLFNGKTIEDRFLAKLSCLGELVYCFVEDHVMFSCASGWKVGETAWSVTHDCEKGRFHLDITGNPPQALERIQDQLTAEQNASGGEKSDVDFIYDIPAELAKELTGFRHDRDIPGTTDDPFQALEYVQKNTGMKFVKAFKEVFMKKNKSQ